METIKKKYSMQDAYGFSFDGREMKIDISTATKIMLYPEFMICNKTLTDIHYHERSLIHARSNDFMY
jgi:hypothetical protein